MPRSIPRYRKHKSGQAVVSIDGVDIYLGKYDTPASREEYTRLVTEYMARKPMLGGMSRVRLTVNRAVDRFWFAGMERFDKRKKHHFKQAFKPLVRLYGEKAIADFGPVWFKAIRAEYVSLGWSRQHTNVQADRLKQFLKWLVGMELFDVSKLASIREVPRLKPGEARETDEVVPVPWATVEATLPKLPCPVRRLVLTMWHTGMRPDEACRMRFDEIDRSGTLEVPGGEVIAIPGVWSWRMKSHKNDWREHRRARIVLIGPQGQAALGSGDGGYAFDPRTVAKNPHSRERYRSHAVSTAVKRACLRAKADHWHPNQLRHSAGTRFRAAGGKDVAATLLGHKGVTITERYAKDDWVKAAEVIAKIG